MSSNPDTTALKVYMRYRFLQAAVKYATITEPVILFTDSSFNDMLKEVTDELIAAFKENNND